MTSNILSKSLPMAALGVLLLAMPAVAQEDYAEKLSPDANIELDELPPGATARTLPPAGRTLHGTGNNERWDSSRN